MKAYHQLKKNFNHLAKLDYIHHVMAWDEAVMMPVGAGATSGNALAALGVISQKFLKTKKNKQLIDAAKHENLSPWDIANLAIMEKKYLRSTVIPTTLMEKMTQERYSCQQIWRTLREENNWQDFQPHLERTFKLVKEVAKRYGALFDLDPYDAMLDEWSPGFNQKRIDNTFKDLTLQLPSLIQQIRDRQSDVHIETPNGPFSVESQKNLGLKVMQDLQFDFTRGRLDVSHHPFCSGGHTDIRITTRYNEKEFISSLLGTCHETGHALYELGMPSEWIGQPVGKINSMAMHESQSLLIEMQVCRSKEFINYLLPIIQNQFGKQSALTNENLYKLITKVKPGFIRVDADEVTYPLHVVLRYEIEKLLMNGELLIKDLPAYWNERMGNYLGLSTQDNFKDGVMQDVHWPAGLFGYFPSYTLGRLIAAQLFSTFTQSNPNFFMEVSHGNFTSLHSWLKNNVYRHASSLTTDDLLIITTGKALDSNFFIQHIKQRYLN